MIIKKKDIYFVLLILFILPSGIMSFSPFTILKPFVQYGKYIAILCVGVDILLHFKSTLKEYKFSLMSALFGMSFFVYLYSTPSIRDMRHLKFYISIPLGFLCVAYITEYFVKKHKHYFIKNMYRYYSAILYFNFLFMLIKPKGFYKVGDNMIFLIAQDNGLILYIICGLMFTLLYDYMYKLKYRFELLVMISVCLLTAIISQSATALVTSIIYLILLIIINLWGKNKVIFHIVNVRNISIFYLLINYFIYF